MVVLGHYLIAVARRGSNGNSIGGSGGDSSHKSTEIEVEIINAKGKLVEGVIYVLESGFDDVAATGIWSGSVLANSVGQGIVSGAFFTGGDVEVTPVDDITR